MTAIGIVDYGMGNVLSVKNALRFLGVDSALVRRARDLTACQGFILPGVGCYGEAMANLTRQDLVAALSDQVLGNGKPVLGICLGMQILSDGSEESEGVAGLGWLGGQVELVAPDRRDDPDIQRPHVGWNDVHMTEPEHPLFARLGAHDAFYFDHTYALERDHAATVAHADYHGSVPAAVTRDNIHAVQFHPEKSQRAGLILLRNFTNIVLGRPIGAVGPPRAEAAPC